MGVFAHLHAAGHTVVVVTHDADVAAFARRIIRLKDGQVEGESRSTTDGV
jgi:ABC-type lipoprotein export system ATPase subunit